MKIKYSTSPESRNFLQQARAEVEEHFKQRHKSPHANVQLWLKVTGILLVWLFSYLAILSGIFGTAWVLAFVGIHGLSHLLIAFNISHDANHKALSKSKTVNDVLSYSLGLLGLSSYFWKIAHNQEHHSYINVHEVDSNINGYGILRFTPADEHKQAFRFQHVYAMLVYGLVTLNYVLVKDFKLMYYALRDGQKVPTTAFFELAIVKVFYVSYIFVIPYLVLGVGFWPILASFLVVQFCIGILLSIVFQCGHFTLDAHFPEVINGTIQDGWGIHTLKTTCDYAASNQVFTQLVGGINIHIPHHLFPEICHIHYKELVPIIQKVATEFGLPYRNYDTISEAVSSHLKLLKTLGEETHIQHEVQTISEVVEA